jgi:hypothetical protein
MADRANLTRITQLYQESSEITQALDNLANGGVIINMTISGGPLTPPSPGEPPTMRIPASLSTIGIEYPPAMTAGITAALQARIGAINNELATLGITG